MNDSVLIRSERAQWQRDENKRYEWEMRRRAGEPKHEWQQRERLENEQYEHRMKGIETEIVATIIRIFL
jgi:hypothetical protein